MNTSTKTLAALGSTAELGAAVLVGGKVVAWFVTWDESALDWCRANHFGRWLAIRAKSPEIVPFSSNEIEAAKQRANELMAVFNDLQEPPNA